MAIPKVNVQAAWTPQPARSGVETLVKNMMAMRLKRDEAERQAAEEERAAELHQRQMAEKATEDSLKQVQLLEQLNLLTPPQKMVQEAPVAEMEEPSNEALGIKGGKIKMPLGETQVMDVPQEPGAPVNITLPDGQVVPITPRTRDQQLAAREEEFGRTLGEEEQKQSLKETPASVIFQALGLDVPPGLEDVSLPPAVAQAVAYGQRGRGSAAPKTVTRKDGSVWSIDPMTQEPTQVLEALPAEALNDTAGKPLSDKVIGELSDMRLMARKAEQLIEAPSGYEMEVAGWVPNIVRNFVMTDGSDMTSEAAQQMAAKYQEYQPQYFMFAAEMLKAVQGSRPSDFDMQIYLENLPKISDEPEVKAGKLSRLIGDLTVKYNDRVEAHSSMGRKMGNFEPIPTPSKEEILTKIQGGSETPAGPAPPPPFAR